MVCVWYLLRAQPSRPRRETAASAGGDRDACEARHEGAVTRATGRCQRSCLKRLSTTHMRCSKSPLSRANLALPGRRGRLGQYHQKSADLTINRRVNWVLAIPRSHRTAPQGRCVLRRDWYSTKHDGHAWTGRHGNSCARSRSPVRPEFRQWQMLHEEWKGHRGHRRPRHASFDAF